jgi:hypothetical protein
MGWLPRASSVRVDSKGKRDADASSTREEVGWRLAHEVVACVAYRAWSLMELARELPKVSLEDALRLCLLLAEKEPDPFERAAVTWLGRLALELTPRGGPLALVALRPLPSTAAERALHELARRWIDVSSAPPRRRMRVEQVSRGFKAELRKGSTVMRQTHTRH